MPEPILRAVTCPESILAKTRNAKATLRLLTDTGWDAVATYAIGWTLPKVMTKKAQAEAEAQREEDDEEIEVILPPNVVASILIRAHVEADNEGHVHDEYLEASWVGEPGAALSFDGCWYGGPTGRRRMTYTEMGHFLKGTKPVPTAKQIEAMENDTALMMEAVKNAMMVAAPLRVLPLGDSAPRCQGKVRAGALWLPCASPADHLGVLCSDGCMVGLMEAGFEPCRDKKSCGHGT